jgi:hypothetical protein
MRPSLPSRRRSQLPPNNASTSARLPVITQMLCGQLLQTPRRRRPTGLDGLERPSGRKQPRGDQHPIEHLVAGPLPGSVHLGKAGRPARRKLAHHLRLELTPMS